MKKLTALFLALLMALSLCACGSQSSAKVAAAPAMNDYAYSEEAYEYASPAEAPAPYAGDSVGGAGGAGGFSDSAIGDAALSAESSFNPDKIIYSSNVTVETTAFEESVKGLDELIEKYGGWVESSSVQGSNYYSKSRGYTYNRSASYTLRIPSKNFSEIMGSLSQLGNVPYTYTYTENVTAQYYDTQARLTAYQAQSDRLLEMMSKAETVSDVIVIENELTELQYKIDSLTSSLKNWDRQVEYSYIYLSVNEVQEYTPEVTPETPFAQQLKTAFSGGLSGAVRFFKSFALFIAEALPFLVVIGIILAVILLSRKGRRSQPRRERRAEKARAKAEAKARKRTEKQEREAQKCADKPDKSAPQVSAETVSEESKDGE